MPWFQSLRDFRRDVLSEAKLEETIGRLVTEGELTPERAAALIETVRHSGADTRYVIGHLCVHLAIGIATPDVLFLPLGMIGRALWVVGCRIVETLRGRFARARFHSPWVFGVSLIPYAGNLAYLIPLRATNADAPYLYANHISYLRSGASLEQALQKMPVWRQRLIRRIVGSPPKESPASPGTSPSS